MSATGAYFLGGARGRLLPASIPLRFFGAAVVFHLLAWLVLIACAGQWTGFAGGLGWPLAALHLMTLGVLGMMALGAGAQLLPVATRQPAPRHRWLAAVWWLYTPGVGLLTLGMGLARPTLLAAGALAVALALVVWGVLVALNLRGARGMPGVVAHVWTALLSLVVLLGSAGALAAVWLGMPGWNRASALLLHLVFAPFGFMGMLALGLSSILVPMFALADAPAERQQLGAWGLASAALLLASGAALGIAPDALLIAALLAGLGAAAWHVTLMQRALRNGMRRELGRSFTLVRLGWAGLFASLALALAIVLQAPLPRLPVWLALSLIGVWLLSFALGMLQRIVPFLAAMHGGGSGRRARTPSALTHETALRVHFVCHVAALALLAGALASGHALVALAGAVVGAVGALAFCVFYATALRRMQAGPV
ncbi:MAG TPA: hypothetical protein VGE16_00390 [Albitalea sp.]